MGGVSRRESLLLLETAFDCGIRHFDTAPAYGYGQAETCLGTFLSRRRGDVTVTTKFGLLPPLARTRGGTRLVRLAMGVARPLARRWPGVVPTIQLGRQSVLRGSGRPALTGEAAERSLDASLSALGVDHIDLWLLHEVNPEDLLDPTLLPSMREAVRGGRVGAFGVGATRERISRIVESRPHFAEVVQCEWSASAPYLAFPQSFVLMHGVVQPSMMKLRQWFERNPGAQRLWSEELGRDLSEPKTLASLLLTAALMANPGTVVLFFSRNTDHIRANVAVAEDASLRPVAARLSELAYSALTTEARPVAERCSE
jgi:D-threo-aldose 1-dehydrogenase